MPAIVEHIKKHWVWYAGGAAVLVAIWYIRSRQQASAGAAAPSDSSSFGAGATSPSAPASSGGVTNNFADQLAQLQLAAAGEQLSEQKALFGLQFGQQQQSAALEGQYQAGVLPAAIAAGQAQFSDLASQFGAEAKQAAYSGEISTQEQKQLSKTGISCPGKASPRLMPNAAGEMVWQCREKTSGGILGIPIGQIVDAISNAVGGVQKGIGPAAEQATRGAGQATSSALQQVIPNLLFGSAGINTKATYGQQGVGVQQPLPAVVKTV